MIRGSFVLFLVLGVLISTDTSAQAGGDCSGATSSGANAFHAIGVCHRGEEGTPTLEIEPVTGGSEPTYSYEPVCIRGAMRYSCSD